ncbi:MAG: glycerophosphodiester phosphodiesterase family protein [Phycisphaerales bacterium]|jgi:glycerophosphoryl diester phosphodiesterase
MRCPTCILIAVLSFASTGLAPAADDRPLVLAHRGASGHLPEHTLAAYTLAWSMGADYLEPDVVLTKDGVAICAHDVNMERVTDVAERFPGRAREDGRWYWIDFTLEEVRTLRVTYAGAGGEVGGAVPTFEEFLRLVDRLNAIGGEDGRTPVGVIPEPKRPEFHRNHGHSVELRVLATLVENGYEAEDDPAIIQCFDLDALERLEQVGCLVRLVWLLGEEPSDADLERAAGFCHGLGPSRKLLEDEDTGEPLPLLAQSREFGLMLYPYTFKDEPRAMARFFHEYGVAGLFTDFPGAGRRAADGAIQPDRSRPGE